MKCILMNKNKEVLVTEYDSANGVFSKISEINDIKLCSLYFNKFL